MTARTIDLGLIDSDQSEIDRPRRAGQLRCSWPAALLVLAITMTMTAATPAPPPRITPLLSVPGGQQSILTDEHLYVLGEERERRSGARTAMTLTAYRLADGSQRWQVSYPGAVSFEVVRDVPLVSGWGTGRTGTTALEPATGAARWHREGYPIGAAGDRVLLGWFRLAGHRLTDTTSAITAVELTTGAAAWHRDTVGLRSHASGEYLVTLTSSGALHSFDLLSGRQLATASVPGIAVTASVQVIGSQILVRDGGGNTVNLAAYDAETLQRQWRTTLPGDTEPWACGRLLCVIHDERLHVIERATGQPAWPSINPEPFPRAPSVTYLAGSDRLLLTSASTRTPTWTVGAASGQNGAALPGWVRPRPRTVRIHSTEPAHAVLLRSDPDGPATWVGRLDPDTGALRVLGAVPDTLTPLCTATAAVMACRSVDQGRTIQVWRLRWR